MNAKLSQQMSLLALAAVLFYGVLLAADLISAEMLPQFVVSAFIFFTSSRLMRKPAAASDEDEEDVQTKKQLREEDWAWLSLLLNWGMSLLILAALALWVMMPAGVDLIDAFQQSSAHESFFSGYVP